MRLQQPFEHFLNRKASTIRERLKKRGDTKGPVQRRPKGIARPITQAWKDEVQREMKVAGVDRQQLAKLIGASPAAITVLFRKTTQVSRLVDDIVRVLHVPPPEYLDARDFEVVSDMRKLRTTDPAEYDKLAGRARARLDRKPN